MARNTGQQAGKTCQDCRCSRDGRAWLGADTRAREMADMAETVKLSPWSESGTVSGMLEPECNGVYSVK